MLRDLALYAVSRACTSLFYPFPSEFPMQPAFVLALCLLCGTVAFPVHAQAQSRAVTSAGTALPPDTLLLARPFELSQWTPDPVAYQFASRDSLLISHFTASIAERSRPWWLIPAVGAVLGGTYFGIDYIRSCTECFIGPVAWVAIGAGAGAAAGGLVELIVRAFKP